MNRKFNKNQRPNLGPDGIGGDTSHKSELRSQLQKNFKKKRNANIGVLAMISVTCIVLFSTAEFTDVGSDSFSLFENKNPEENYYQVKTHFKDAVYGGDPDSNQSRDEFRQQMEIVHEAKMAGDKKVLGMTACTIKGVTYFTEEYEVKVPGGTRIMHGDPATGPRMGKEEAMVMVNYGAEIFADIKSGRAKSLPMVKCKVDGIEYSFQRWAKYIKGYGEVIYWDSVDTKQ